MRDCYVYTLNDPRDFDRVIYVGAGSGHRVLDRNRNLRVRSFIAEHGEPFFDIVAANMTQESALILETALIAKHKRIDEGGTLLNINLVGHGSRPKLTPKAAAEAKEKRREYRRRWMQAKRSAKPQA